jgi:hypothetical protein
MATTVAPVIHKHWLVCGFILPEEGAVPPDDLGHLGQIDNTLYRTVEEAKVRAKQLAVQAPGSYYVVYEAQWYAYTDATPVNIIRVGAPISVEA